MEIKIRKDNLEDIELIISLMSIINKNLWENINKLDKIIT